MPSVRCYDCGGPSGGKTVCGPCLLLGQLRDKGIMATREYQFAPPRKWRADLYIIQNVTGLGACGECGRSSLDEWLIEVDGGVWTGGRHSGGKGQVRDFEKGNAAVMRGYRVLHYTPEQVENGAAAQEIGQLMEVD